MWKSGRGRKPSNVPIKEIVSMRIAPDTLKKLDAYIDWLRSDGTRLTRSDAISRSVEEWLDKNMPAEMQQEFNQAIDDSLTLVVGDADYGSWKPFCSWWLDCAFDMTLMDENGSKKSKLKLMDWETGLRAQTLARSYAVTPLEQGAVRVSLSLYMPNRQTTYIKTNGPKQLARVVSIPLTEQGIINALKGALWGRNVDIFSVQSIIHTSTAGTKTGAMVNVEYWEAL